jgi:putative PIN family toxin of toxin-antitoxin system
MKAEGAGLIAVVDTNVWISAFLSKSSAPALAVRQVILYGRPVFSLATFSELQERLWRPKFDRYLSLDYRKQLLRDVDASALWVMIPPEIAQQTFCRDPDDDKFIHVALTAKVPWLVSGDQDLLVITNKLQPWGVQILSPAEALLQPGFNTHTR